MEANAEGAVPGEHANPVAVRRTFELRPAATEAAHARLPSDGRLGVALHAAFLTWLERHSASTARALHDAGRIAPFSLWWRVVEGGSRVTVTVLDPAHFDAFARAPDGVDMWQVGRTAAEVRAGSGEPVFLRVPARWETLTLRFCSPTTFRSGKVHRLFPEPERVFFGVEERWRAFVGEDRGAAAAGPGALDFGQLLWVARHRVETRLWDFGRYKMIGFVGEVQYRLAPEATPAQARQIARLALYAQWAGVGYKTTMGLGHVTVTLR